MPDVIRPIFYAVFPQHLANNVRRSADFTVRISDTGGSKLNRTSVSATVSVNGGQDAAIISNGVVQPNTGWETTTVDSYEEDEETTVIDLVFKKNTTLSYGDVVDITATASDNDGNLGATTFTYKVQENPVYDGSEPTDAELEICTPIESHDFLEQFRRTILRSLITESIPAVSDTVSSGSLSFEKQDFEAQSLPGIVISIPDGFEVKTYIFYNAAGGSNGAVFDANPNWTVIDVGGDVGNGNIEAEALGVAVRAHAVLSATLQNTQVAINHVYNGEENVANHVRSVISLQAPSASDLYNYPIHHDLYQHFSPGIPPTTLAGLQTLGISYQGMSGGMQAGLEPFGSRMSARRLFQILRKTSTGMFIRNLWGEEPGDNLGVVRSSKSLSVLSSSKEKYSSEYARLKNYARNTLNIPEMGTEQFELFEAQSVSALGSEELAKCCMALVYLCKLRVQGTIL